MKDFLKEYWLWIVVPVLVIFAGLVGLLWMAGSETGSPFVYPVF